MDELKDFVANNPQVSASMVTALFGILGIFINILINLWFRNRDYKYKNLMQQIESLETYYIPLGEKTKYFMNCIQKVASNESDDLYNILDDKIGAKYANSIMALQQALEEYNSFFEQTEYKYPNSYELFRIHRKVKEKIFILSQFVEKKIKLSSKETVKETISDLSYLVYQIQQYENKILINNYIIRCIEKIKLWKFYKKM